MTNSFVSMKGGRATDRAFFNRCDASLPSLVRTSSTQPPPAARLHSASCRCGTTSSSVNHTGSSGVHSVLQMTTCHSLRATCAMFCSPEGCYKVIRPGEWRRN